MNGSGKTNLIKSVLSKTQIYTIYLSLFDFADISKVYFEFEKLFRNYKELFPGRKIEIYKWNDAYDLFLDFPFNEFYIVTPLNFRLSMIFRTSRFLILIKKI
jgi:hypothetical protein